MLIFVGITGSSAYQIEQNVSLHPGESALVGAFTLQYDDLTRVIEPTHEAFIAKLTVSRHGKYLTTLYPEKRLYFAQNQPTTEVALRTSLLEDLYIIMAGFEPSKTVTFKVFVNPWFSGCGWAVLCWSWERSSLFGPSVVRMEQDGSIP